MSKRSRGGGGGRRWWKDPSINPGLPVHVFRWSGQCFADCYISLLLLLTNSWILTACCTRRAYFPPAEGTIHLCIPGPSSLTIAKLKTHFIFLFFKKNPYKKAGCGENKTRITVLLVCFFHSFFSLPPVQIQQIYTITFSLFKIALENKLTKCICKNMAGCKKCC